MQVPLQVTFRNMSPSPAIEAAMRERAEKLEKFCPEMISCLVEIEAPHQHHRQGKLYGVRLRITVPGREIDVTHGSDQDHTHEDPYVAIRDAFRAARRQLEDYTRKRRGDVKHHTEPDRG